MGLFSSIFGNKDKKNVDVKKHFESLTAYAPMFTNFDGGVYELELTRAIINNFATACSKLKPSVKGTAQPSLNNILKYRPNQHMNTIQFIAKVATNFAVTNNSFIVPVLDEYGNITGYYPISPTVTEVVEHNGVEYFRFTFNTGERVAIEKNRVGHLTQFQYNDDFFGEDNSVLKPTMNLIHTQNQAIISAVKNSATIRLLAVMGTVKGHDDDLEDERKRFVETNFSSKNDGGVIFTDSRFTDIKTLNLRPYTVDHAQMKQIQENAFNYFGTNEKILQNKFNEDEWNAYYEGKIAPFAYALSLALTNMTFSQRELSFGNEITFSDNMLNYASSATRERRATAGFDRGQLSVNESRELFGQPAVPDGNKYYIRKEYAEKDKLHEDDDGNAYNELGGDEDGKS